MYSRLRSIRTTLCTSFHTSRKSTWLLPTDQPDVPRPSGVTTIEPASSPICLITPGTTAAARCARGLRGGGRDVGAVLHASAAGVGLAGGDGHSQVARAAGQRGGQLRLDRVVVAGSVGRDGAGGQRLDRSAREILREGVVAGQEQ